MMPKPVRKIQVSLRKTATPSETKIRTKIALLFETLNLTLRKEKVGILETMSIAIATTQITIHSGYDNGLIFMAKRLEIKSSPIGISINPAPAGAGTPKK